MESVNYIRPMRSVIRCKAKMQLLQAASDPTAEPLCISDELLRELAATVFNSSRYQTLLQYCRSQSDADAIEDRVAAELAETYQYIRQRQQDPVVQRLNALLKNP